MIRNKKLVYSLPVTLAAAAAVLGIAIPANAAPIRAERASSLSTPHLKPNSAIPHNRFVGSTVVNKNSGKCLEVYYSSTAAGAAVDQWGCNQTLTQLWSLNYLGAAPNGAYIYQLVNQNSGQCLDVTSYAVGASVVQNPCDSATNSWWTELTDGSGYSRFQNYDTGQMLEVYQSSTNNGAKVDQYPGNWTATA
ncbi:RICIN domain-containing protein [Kitasatospora acidiphila]|nr:RICIN domain-containing protein [Kitasatospora acidiphila]